MTLHKTNYISVRHRLFIYGKNTLCDNGRVIKCRAYVFLSRYVGYVAGPLKQKYYISNLRKEEESLTLIRNNIEICLKGGT